ncbi:MAG TPA: glycoside hydrolase family 38 C-terminal domain-containing protein, partial [Gemmataceae bacterium]|nr:glycoside hydrolase family 38 C-terminal domain-containing protein [Gemmataceae bacterium]
TFGHHAQMPQLLKLGGYKSFWFSRGVPKPDHPSEFLWEGIDGTRIPAFWLPYSYGLMYGSPRDLPGFHKFVQQRFDALGPNARGPDRVGLSGVDVCEPEEHLAPLVAKYNRQKDRPLALRLAVPTDFEAVVARRADRPVFKGELNPIFQGTYSSRIELKQRMRTMERLLTTAEKLGALAGWLGAPAHGRALRQAWEPVLFNETHDLASGVMTDHVYEDTVRGYDFAGRQADGLIDQGWDALAARIDTRGDGIPVVVFNTLGWPRTDLAEVTVGFSDRSVTGVAVTDAAGREVSVQLEEAARYGDGGLKVARLAFLARDVPALGYGTYHVMAKRAGRTQEAGPAEGPTLENEFYQVKLDPATGALTSLVVKDGNWEVFRAHANVVARSPDHGDLWELYQGLNGGSKIAMTRKQPVPRPGDAKFSSDFKGKPATTRGGPVFAEFRVFHPFGNGTFATTVRLAAGTRRIDIRTALVNNEKYVRYQALFPTTIRNGKSIHAIPFGAIERPAGIEFPAQDWVDYGDGRHGLALLNVGLPGNVVTDGTLMLSLLRSHTLGAYGFGGGYEPGMSSESGFQLGKERTLHYALVPHAGDWRQAGVYREGLELNNPLVCRKVLAHAGPLLGRWGFARVSRPNVVVTALRPGRRGAIVLRLFEATGKAAVGVKVKLPAKVTSAREANLMEEPGRGLKVHEDTVEFDLGPFEIKTCSLQLAPPRGLATGDGPPR